MGWLTGWKYRKKHEIVGSTAGPVTDYQVRIIVHYGSGTDSGEHVYLNGKCREDFGDIRFTDSDGSTELPYWMEEKVDGDYAIFWVKVPSIPANPNTATIYIYYGKPDATTTSNGDDTFIFFDDFESTDIDTNKWIVERVTGGEWSTETSAYYELVNSELHIHYYGYDSDHDCDVTGADKNGWRLRSVPIDVPTDAGLRIIAKTRWANTDWYRAWGYLLSVLIEVSSTEMYGQTLYYYGDYKCVVLTRKGTTSSYVNVGESSSGIANFDYRYYGGNLVTELTGTYSKSDNFSVTLSTIRIRIETAPGACWGNAVTADAYYDVIYVRKYIDPEPSHGAWGSEESILEVEVRDLAYLLDSTSKSTFKSLSEASKALDYVGRVTAKILAELVVAKDYKGFAKDLIELVVPCDKVVSSRLVLVSLFDYVVPEYLLSALRAREVRDSVKAVDSISRTALFTKSLTDSGRATDYMRKSVTITRYDTSVSLDLISLSVIRNFIDTYVGVDRVSKGILVRRHDSSLVTDRAERSVAFLRSLADSSKGADYLRKSVSIARSEVTHALDYISRSMVRYFIDLGKALDYVGKVASFTRSLRDSSLATDRVSRLSTKVYADLAKVSDASFRELIKSLLDYVVPEYVLSSLRGKELRDLATVADRLGLGIPQRVYDVAKVTDRKSHDVVCNFTDASLVTDYVFRGLIKSIIDRVAPEFCTSKTPLRAVADAVLPLDRIGLGIPYRIYETVKVADRKSIVLLRTIYDVSKAADLLYHVIAKVIALRDYVVPEYVTSKGIGKVSIEVGKVKEALVQWLVTIYGYTLEMPYLYTLEKPYLEAKIMPEHFNNPYYILLSFLGDVKVCWSKLSGEPYPESIADLEDTLASLKPVKTGEYVRIEHVDVTMVACYYLYKAVKDCYDKYKEVYGQEIPLVEEHLSRAYEIVYSPTIVKVGDIILPEHFIQIYIALMYLRVALTQLMDSI